MKLASTALVVIGVLAAGPAAADKGVVIESYTGTRPADAGRMLAPFLEEMTTGGFAVGYDGVGRKYEHEVSRPARTASGMPGDFADQIERGHKAWIKGNYDDAITTLTEAVDAAHGNAAAVSQNQALIADIKRGLVDLALAHQRQGNPHDAEATMAEYLRSFPQAPVTRAANGPEAFTLFEATRKKLAVTGTLVVEVVDSSTQVFVNEQYAKTGSLRWTKVAPGTYRVYAALGANEGRTYSVEVAPGGTGTLRIDIGFDAALHIEPGWVGLAFDSVDNRDKLEGVYAAQFARLAGASAIAVVGVDTVKDRPALVGALIAIDTGRVLRLASVPIPATPTAVRALARFLGGDDSARSSVDVLDPEGHDRGPAVGPGPGPTERPHRSGGRRWGVLKYITTGVGLAAAGVGTYLVLIDNTCTTDADPCPQLYHHTAAAWATLGGGAAVVGLGIYMFLTDKKPDEQPITVAPTRGGAMASFRMSF